jgi:hypothetical protein
VRSQNSQADTKPDKLRLRLDRPCCGVLGAVAAKGSSFVSRVKARSDVELLMVSPGDRDRYASHHHRRDHR